MPHLDLYVLVAFTKKSYEEIYQAILPNVTCTSTNIPLYMCRLQNKAKALM